MDLNNFIFNNQKITIILDDNNEPWFKAKDIALILEYTDTDQAIRKNIDEDDKQYMKDLRPVSHTALSYNEKNTIYINESGLYSLILSSKKEEAKKFKKWVTSDVLPSLRKHGEYKFKEEIEILTSNFQQQLNLKEETIRLKIKEEEKNKLELQKAQKLNEDYKEYCTRIQSLEKKDIIYILTNDIDVQENKFKLGKTRLNHLKKRLSVYNTGATNKYYYVYYKEVFNGEQIEKRFHELMNRYNIRVDGKINKEIYQLYLPDFEFYLEKVIDSNDFILDLINQNHETIFLNSKNKKSIVTKILIEEEITKNIKINNKIVKTYYFDDLNKTEQIKIIREIINQVENDIKRKDLENTIKNNYSLVVNKKMPFWNLVKEVNQNKNVKVTYF